MATLFALGDAVRLDRDVHNDGTYPGAERGALLVPRGCIGYVRDVGYFLQDQLIYTVHFLEQGRLVGCRGVELRRPHEPWLPNRYRVHDRVRLQHAIEVNGEVVAAAETGVTVSRVVPGSDGMAYHIRVGERLFRVPEALLLPG